MQKGERMNFRDRWINFLHRAATGIKKTRTLQTPVGLQFLYVFTINYLQFFNTLSAANFPVNMDIGTPPGL